MAGLERLQGRARAASVALGRARRSLPGTGQGRDGAGAVAVTVGADQLPVQVRVAADWDRRVEPGGLGAAVVAACRAAAADRFTAWADQLVEQRALPSQAPRSPVRERAAVAHPPAPVRPGGEVSGPRWRTGDDGRDGRGGGAAAGPAGAGVGGPAVEVAVAELQEQLTAAFRARPRPGPPGTAPVPDGRAGDGVVTGCAAGGRIRVTAGAGGVLGCEAAPAWVAGQGAARLTMALQDAVADARAQLTAAATGPPGRPGPSGTSRAPDEPGVDLDGLVDAAARLVQRAARAAGGGSR